jgi:hypothetical protein
MNGIDESIKKELWFTYFTKILYKQRIITEEQKIELEKRIGMLSENKKEVA